MGRFGFGVSCPNILRGTNQQTEQNLVYLPPEETLHGQGSATQSAGAPLVRRMTGLIIRAFELNNRTAGSAICGIGYRTANRFWSVGRLTAGDVYTDVTANAQSSTLTFTLGTDAANDAIIITSVYPFDWVSINITTAEVDAGLAVDHTVTYSNFAGTGWSTPTAAEIFMTDTVTRTNVAWPTGELRFVWRRPADWGKIVAITGLTTPFAGRYAVRFTTAEIGVGDTAAIATGMEIGTMVGTADTAATNTIYAAEDIMAPSVEGEAVMTFFSVADAGNTAYVECYPWG